MSLLGANVSARGELSVATIKESGAAWCRFVLLPTFDATEYMQALYQAGIDYLPVFARESWDGFVADRADGLSFYTALYGRLIHQLQVGNEPDATEGNSSWVMSPGDYSTLLGQARWFFPHARIVTAGMVSGQPSWLNGVALENADIVACHPYAKEPGSTDLDDMLWGYRGFGKPLWVTEFDSRKPNMAKWLARDEAVERAAIFCLHDYLDFGVINRPERLAEFREAAGWQPAPAPIPIPEVPPVPRYEFTLGIKAEADRLRALGIDVGEPTESETYLFPGAPYSLQFTNRGYFMYSATAGTAHFFAAKGKAA